jgi:transposase
VIEVLDGRDRRTIERWLSALPADVRVGIEVVSIDPYDAYRQAIHAALPHARIVCDHFHLVRGANAALDAAAASASARPRPGARRACAAAARTPPGAQSSTAPATGCSRLASASPRVSADG